VATEPDGPCKHPGDVKVINNGPGWRSHGSQ
jgi:hypothetical protein